MADDVINEPEVIEPVAAEPASTEPVAEPATETVVDDWRHRMSGGDDKLLGYLARIPSEKAAIEKLKRYEDDFKAGKFLKPAGADASDEDKAAWNAALGVPDKAEDYYTTLPEGLVVGEDDKPFVDTFLSAMHETGAAPAAVGAALDAYYKIVEDQQAVELDADAAYAEQTQEVLRQEWPGGEYKRNVNIVNGFLNTLPEAVAETFKMARGADGRPIGDNPEVLRWLASLALDKNPVATIVPGSGADQAQTVNEEIAKLEGVMRSDRRKWNADEAMQERYRTLLDAREKLKSQ